MSKDITIRVIVEGNGTSSPLVCIQDEGELLQLRKLVRHNDAIMTANKNQIQNLLTNQELDQQLLKSKDRLMDDMQNTINRIKPENVTLLEQNKRLQRELVNQKQSYDTMDKAWRGSLAEHNKTSYARIERLETEIEALSKEIGRLRGKLGMKPGEI